MNKRIIVARRSHYHSHSSPPSDLISNRIRIAITKATIATWLAGTALSPALGDGDLHIVDLPLSICQRGVDRRLVIEGQGVSPRRPDHSLVGMVARAHAYLDALTDGQGLGGKDVAKRFGVHPEDLSRVLPLAFCLRATSRRCSPASSLPISSRVTWRTIELPVSWTAQSKLLGI